MSTTPAAPSRSARREATENALLDALETVLVRDGLRDLSVNAVVDQAGVGKPLLYRYFGDLGGLLSAWAERRAFMPAAQHIERPERHAEPDGEFLARVAEELVASGDYLRDHPVLLELLAEELTADSSLSDAFAHARRRQSAPFLRAMLKDDRYVEPRVRSRIIVLYAAVTYLAMRAQRAPAFMGLRLDTPEGWDEAMRMVRDMAVFDDTESGREPGEDDGNG